MVQGRKKVSFGLSAGRLAYLGSAGFCAMWLGRSLAVALQRCLCVKESLGWYKSHETKV